MTDSSSPDAVDSKREENRQQRIEAVKRWVEYIKTEPPEKWGPQQNAIINAQLSAAQHAETSATHQQQVKTVAEELADIQRETGESE